jgi:hypothetical protein
MIFFSIRFCCTWAKQNNNNSQFFNRSTVRSYLLEIGEEGGGSQELPSFIACLHSIRLSTLAISSSYELHYLYHIIRLGVSVASFLEATAVSFDGAAAVDDVRCDFRCTLRRPRSLNNLGNTKMKTSSIS